ncbi:YceI family protein [Formosa haliotis]|uniref:YceI family protein n=1 Tax=Formosa haliotis TaxID=1555194 RepID=UPI0008265D3E|nr:YceI family protein [Formosa haliotis]
MTLKKLAVLLVVIIGLSFVNSTQNKSAFISILPSSKLTVNGVTNIANFACNFNALTLKNKIPVSYTISENSIAFNKAKLVLVNNEFDCGRKLINKDFHKLLKTEDYPEIEINLKEVKRSITKPVRTTATVDFKIAGVTKTYTIPISVSRDHTLKASGDIRLNIRDFGLENPKKVLGLIKIEDVVTIHFQLDIET